MSRIFKIIQVIAWFLFAVMLASLGSVPLYVLFLIFFWDSWINSIFWLWISFNFLGLVMFFYLLLKLVNQRLVAPTSKRKHNAKGR